MLKEILKILQDNSRTTNKQIAARLEVSEWTVIRRVSIILAKLKAQNRAQAVTLARQQGLI